MTWQEISYIYIYIYTCIHISWYCSHHYSLLPKLQSLSNDIILATDEHHFPEKHEKIDRLNYPRSFWFSQIFQTNPDVLWAITPRRLHARWQPPRRCRCWASRGSWLRPVGCDLTSFSSGFLGFFLVCEWARLWPFMGTWPNVFRVINGLGGVVNGEDHPFFPSTRLLYDTMIQKSQCAQNLSHQGWRARATVASKPIP